MTPRAIGFCAVGGTIAGVPTRHIHTRTITGALAWVSLWCDDEKVDKASIEPGFCVGPGVRNDPARRTKTQTPKRRR